MLAVGNKRRHWSFNPMTLLEWLWSTGNTSNKYHWVAQLKHVGVPLVQKMEGELGP